MAFVDILAFQDFLAKHGMRPWWETIRSITILLLVSSTLLFFSPNSNAVSCTSLPSNNSSFCASASSGYVDGTCRLQTNWMIRNLPWLTMVASALAFVANNFWLYLPKVRSCIEKASDTFQQFIDLEKGKQESAGDTLETVKADDLNREDTKFTKEHVNELANLAEYFFTVYRIRNVISFSYSLAYGCVALYFMLQNVLRATRELPCQLRSQYLSCNFICIHMNFVAYRVCLVIHSVASYVQFSLFIWQFWRGQKRSTDKEFGQFRGMKLLGDLMEIEETKFKNFVNQWLKGAKVCDKTVEIRTTESDRATDLL